MLGIIIQARSNSSRLPRKVLLPFYNNNCILEILIDRIKNNTINIPIIIATTINESDDEIETISLNKGVNVYRGDEDNVLLRFIKASEKFKLTKIIRICSDNVLLDMDALNFQILNFDKMSIDYWAYSLRDRTPTILTHFGFWAEAVSLTALKKVSIITDDKKYLEHVTNYVYTHKDIFNIYLDEIPCKIEELNGTARLTIDTKEDFVLMKEIYSQLIKDDVKICISSVFELLTERKDFQEIMKCQIKLNQK